MEEEHIQEVELEFKGMGTKVSIRENDKIKLERIDLSVEGEIENIKILKASDEPTDEEEEKED